MEESIRIRNFKPIILITPQAMLKTHLLVGICQEEVGWLGLVERPNPTTFFIKDIYIVKQKVTPTMTDLDPDGMLELNRNLRAQGVLSPELQAQKGLYLWGHSHVNMGASPSGQDQTQFDTFVKSGAPFFIGMIVNKRKDIHTRLFLRQGGLELEWEKCSVVEYLPEMNAIAEQVAQDVKANVSKIEYKHIRTGAHQGGITSLEEAMLMWDKRDFDVPREYRDHEDKGDKKKKKDKGNGKYKMWDGSKEVGFVTRTRSTPKTAL